MSLTWIFRLHAASAGVFGAALLASPAWVAGLMTPGEVVGAAGVAFGRLYGLMCAVLVVITLSAAASRTSSTRLYAAKCLLACETAGIFVALSFPATAEWALTRWSSVGMYAVFAAAYAWVLFLAPERIAADQSVARSAPAS
jgi:protein-S-isoprenylcysteine O-methyltransferase Ste14